MVKVELFDKQNASLEMILLFSLISVFIFLLSFHELTVINHNVYSSGYITMSAMFDAVNTNVGIINITSLLSTNFFIIFVVLVMDGITKILLIGFIMASFIEAFTNIDIKSKLEIHGIKKMKDHVIICGYSMFSEELTQELKLKNINFVIIDKELIKIEMAKDLKYLAINGNFLSDEVLLNAGIQRAKYIVFGVKSDYSNLLGIITAKNLNKNIKIISRATDHISIKYFEDISIGKYFIPEYIAGNEIGFVLLELPHNNKTIKNDSSFDKNNLV